MDFKDNRAIFLQIADAICDDVLAGKLLPGNRIPSVREYAARLEVNANTVMRSYEYLSQAGIVFNRRGIGFYIADDAPALILDRRRREFLDGELLHVFGQLRLLDIAPEALSQMYNDYLQSTK